MEAIILAGGFGTRLKEEVPDLPKPMAPIAGKPFLEYLLTGLAQKGFSRVIISLGYLADKITGYFGDQFSGMELAYVIEDIPLGTGGGIRKALQGCRENHAYIFNGDTYLNLETDKLILLWNRHHQPIVVVREIENTARYGRIETDLSGYITAFTEKGSAGKGLINAGCYVLPRNALEAFPLDSNFSLENDYLKKNVSRQKIMTFISQGYFIDIGIPEDFKRAQSELPREIACP